MGEEGGGEKVKNYGVTAECVVPYVGKGKEKGKSLNCKQRFWIFFNVPSLSLLGCVQCGEGG